MEKSIYGRKLSLVIALAILVTSVFAPASFATSNASSVVNGRILTPDKSGDSVNWIEVARDGKNSLIVRSSYINWYPNGHYGDPVWQHTPYGWGNSNSYSESYIRQIINYWFNGTAVTYSTPIDNLPANANLRKYTMSNNALSVLGTCNNAAAMTNGFSSAGANQVGKGNDIAFALSYSETANYISLLHFRRDTNPAGQTSNATARLNFDKLFIPYFSSARLYGMWLRSPGDSSYTGGFMSGGAPTSIYDTGRVFQANIDTNFNLESGLVYPALWVDSGIFEAEKYPVTVNYYKDSITPANQIGSDPLDPMPVGTIVTVNATKYATDDYVVPGDVSGDTVVQAKNNVINVLYHKKPLYPIKVNYYKDSISTGNLFKSIDLPPQLEGTYIYVDLSLDVPDGYQSPGTRSGDTYVAPRQNVVNVVYSPLPKYPIKVNYYKDSIGGEFRGYVDLPPAIAGSDITGVDLTLFAPEGYETPGTRSGDTIVMPRQNVVNVVYDRKANYPIRVNYYKDSLDGEFRGYVDLPPAAFGSTITGVDLARYAPEGYETPGTRSGDIVVAARQNVVNVVYDRKANFPIRVNYYKDSLDGEFRGYVDLPPAAFGSTITGVDLARFAPEGYVTPGTRSGDIVVAARQNIVNVVYDRKANFPIRVNYYKDSLDGEFRGYVDLPPAAFGSTITGVDLARFAPEGYVTPGTRSGDTVVAARQNIVNVVYDRKANFPIRVNYYKDSLDGEFRGYVDLPPAVFGSTITGVDLTRFAPEGYETPGTRSGDTVVAARQNIVNVVYDKKAFFPIKVNYYKDSLSGELRGSIDLPPAEFGSTITGVDLTLFVPDDYATPGMRYGDVVVAARQNVVSVVYTALPLYPIKVNYYKDNLFGELRASIDLPPAIEGSTITGVDLTLYAPEGYETPGTRSGDVVVAPRQNIVNVVYDKKAFFPIKVNYYKDSLGGELRGSVDLPPAEFASTITGVDLTLYAPEGYATPGTRSGDILVAARQNVVNVVYDKKAFFPIKVNYYKDSIAGELRGSIDLPPAEFGSTITGVDLTLFVPDGYETPGIQSGDAVVAARQNIVNVVYSQSPKYPIRVNYYKDSTSGEFRGFVDLPPAIVGTLIDNVDLELYVPDGYATPGVRSGDTVVAARQNIVNVVYSPLPKYPIRVNYYKDSLSGELRASIDLPPATLGTTITGVDLTLYAPEGYKTPGTRSGDTVVAARQNVVNVVYDTKDSFPIKVNYYKDSLAGELRGSVDLPPAEFGSTITGVNLTLYAPEGYEIPGVRSGDTVVAARQNVVNVVYDKKAFFPIRVNYYKDSTAGELRGSVDLPPAEFGSTITGVDLTLYAPDGYTTPGTRSGDTVVAARQNVVNVVYTQMPTYPIRVNYYKDSTSGEFRGYVDLPPAIAGTLIDNVDLTLYAPDGYATPGVRSGDSVVAPRQNIVNVVYSPLPKYPIRVNYYKDSLGGELRASIDLPPATLGTTITGVDLTLYAPEGYETPGTRSGDTVVAARQNIVNVVYDKKAFFPIKVNYYKDSIAGELRGSIDLPSAEFGSTITGVDLTLFVPDGYETPGVRSGDVLVAARQNIVNVVYSQLPKYPIRVNYYKDSTSGEFRGYVDLPPAIVGTLIDNVDLTLYAPDGYATPGVRSGDTIVSARQNIVYVVYSPLPKYPIKVNYYKDSLSGELRASIDLPPAIVGTQIDNVDLELFAPEGYVTPGTRSGDTVVAARQNVVNVVYDTKDFFPIKVNYYKDSIAGELRGSVDLPPAVFGSTITGVDLTLYAPDGYTTPGTPSGDTIVAARQNIVNVVYSQLPKYPIRVNYYKDSLSGELRASLDLPPATLGSTITGVDLTLYAPEGYVTPGTRSGDTVVAARQNVVNVVYDTKDFFPIKVNYYKDSLGGELRGSIDLAPGEFGSTITGVNLTLYAPEGYEIPGVRSGDILVAARQNVVNVVYATKAFFPIRVNYYKDSLSGELRGSIDLAPGEFGSTITGVDLTLFVPDGYETPGMRSGDTVVAARQNVVNVVYSQLPKYPIRVNYYKDSTAGEFRGSVDLPPAIVGTLIDNVDLTLYAPDGYATPGMRSGDTIVSARQNIVYVVYSPLPKYPIRVNYYKDSLSGELRASIDLPTATLGSTITGVDLTLYAPEGYTTPGTRSGDTVVAARQNIVNVVYDTKDFFPIKVNYYKDSLGGELRGSIDLAPAEFGSTITGVNLTLYAPEGYEIPGVRSGDTVVAARQNVVNVIYATKAFFPIKVNYYKDSTAGELRGSIDLAPGEFGSTITGVDLTLFVPDGYETPGMRSGDTVVAARQNVVNVVYSQLPKYPIRVNYYKDSTSGEFRGSVDLPPAIVGTAIDNVDLALYVPDGYATPGARSGDTVVAARQNIVNVVYSPLPKYPIRVNYYKDSLSGELRASIDLPTATLGSTITGVDLTLYAPEGYITPGTRSGDTVVAARQNVVNVVYDTKDFFPIKVNYYKDSLGGELRGSIDLAPAEFGSTITGVNLTLYAPEGYEIPGVRSGDTLVAARQNVVNVVYATKALFPIKVNYYKDSLAGELRGSIDLAPAEFGSTITGVNLTLYAPEGYTTPGTRSGDTVVAARQNVVNVVYGTKDFFPIKVNYYKDSLGGELRGSIDLAPAEFGSTITGVNLTLYAPEGYEIPGVRSGDTVVAARQNVVNVVYATKAFFPIKVNYYKDSTVGELRGSIDLPSAEFGSTITGVDLTLYAPDGYVTPGTRSGDTVVAARQNVVNVVYTAVPKYPIRVNYYKDSLSGELRGSVDLPPAELGSTITGVDLTLYAPEGYATPGVRSGDTVVAARQNVVNVVYGTKDFFPIKVNYYKDSLSGELRGSIDLAPAEFGSTITGVNLTLYAPEGYEIPGVRSGDTVVAARQNVVNVVYAAKAYFPVRVNYYKDSLAGELRGSIDLAPAEFGSTITGVNLTLYAPEGYETPGVRSGDTVVAARQNVVNVVYATKAFFPIRVNYYKDSTGGELRGSIDLPPAEFGSTITGVDLTLYAPDGYTTPGTRSGDTVVAARQNIVNVVYTAVPKYPIRVNYYKDSLSGELRGSVDLPPADLGSTITGVDLTLYAPEGYETPGVRSGDTVVAARQNVVNVVYGTKAFFPIKVNYYKDSLSGELRGSIDLAPAEFGSTITGVNLTLYAPDGYVTPGTRSGDTVVAARQNIVNVVYDTLATHEVKVYYYRDSVTGENFGVDTIYTNKPIGTPVTEVIDLIKYAPPDVVTPGTIAAGSDLYVKDGTTTVFVVYMTKVPETRTVKILHYLQLGIGSIVYDLYETTTIQAKDGDVIIGANYQLNLTPSFLYKDAIPEQIVVSETDTEITLRYDRNPWW